MRAGDETFLRKRANVLIADDCAGEWRAWIRVGSRRIAWLGGGLLMSALAAAHTRSESHSVWEINGGEVDLVMTIPVIETDRLGSGAAPSDERVKAYLTERVYPIAGGPALRSGAAGADAVGDGRLPQVRLHLQVPRRTTCKCISRHSSIWCRATPILRRCKTR